MEGESAGRSLHFIAEIKVKASTDLEGGERARAGASLESSQREGESDRMGERESESSQERRRQLKRESVYFHSRDSGECDSRELKTLFSPICAEK